MDQEHDDEKHQDLEKEEQEDGDEDEEHENDQEVHPPLAPNSEPVMEQVVDIIKWPGPLRWTPSIAVGLANLGNTCYMNSIVQALLHCPMLVAFFSHNWPSIGPIEYNIANRARHDFTNDFALLFQRVWTAGVTNERLQKFYNPISVVRGVIKAVPEFRENGQQDAQEALNYVLNNLHDELTTMIGPEHHPARAVLERLDAEQKVWNQMHRRRKRTASSSSSSAGTSNSGSSKGSQGQKKGRRKFRFRSKSASQQQQQQELPKENSLDEEGDEEEEEEEELEEEGGVEAKQAEEPTFRQLIAPYQQSVINDTFQTLLVQRVMCKRCGYNSLSLEEYFELSLALPSKALMKELRRVEFEENGQRERAFSNSSSTGTGGSSMMWSALKSIKTFVGLESQTLSLRDCLQAFFATEQLINDDQYYCEKCKCKQDAEKSHSLAHLPEVLCFNLKRFNRNMGSWSLNSSKNPTCVTYPLHDLDLGEFFYYRDQQEKGKGGEHSLYDLYAVVRHSGSINGGHYIAYCKNPISQRWYEYDDDLCAPIDESVVQTNDAYLLFYRKLETETCKKKRSEALKVLNVTRGKPCSHYISQYWTLKWDTLVNPGVCGAFEMTCEHGRLLPMVSPESRLRLYTVPKEVYDMLDQLYGCGTPLEELKECQDCTDQRLSLQERRESEKQKIRAMSQANQDNYYIIHNGWVKKWTNFVNNANQRTGRGDWLGVKPPGPVTNEALLEKDGETPKKNRKRNQDFLLVNKDIWQYFMELYGGGPTLFSLNQDLYNLDDETDLINRKQGDEDDNEEEEDAGRATN